MKFSNTNVATQPEILNRKLGGELFTPITIKDSAFVDGVVKAGSPIKADGTIDNTSSSEAIGILLYDVTSDNPNGSILKAFGTVNKAVAEKNAGITYDASVLAALPLVVFE